MPFVVEPMQLEDIPEVTAIERQSFTTPWPVYAYRRELKDNRNSRYIVIRWLEPQNGAERHELEPSQPLTEATSSQAPSGHESTGSGVFRAVSKFLPFWRQAEPPPAPAEATRGTVVGYAGLWLVIDEGHITTIAVRPDMRGQGLGELMLIKLIELAQEIGVDRMTLEVRVSNTVAQDLYRKYTFQVEGVRRRYYSDDNEDALVMWSEPVNKPEFKARFEQLRVALHQRLGDRLAGVRPS